MSLRDKFWQWYEKNYALNVGISALLFLLQVVHLVWLATNVVSVRLTGTVLWEVNDFWQNIIILIDYTEIPALIAASLVYIHGLRKKANIKDAFYLFLVNTQWLHLFWITDEFVVGQLVHSHASMLPSWLAWIAILIDYLELPVIYDTIKRFFVSLKNKANI